MLTSHTTANRHGYSVRFSSFEPNHLLMASSELYGFMGGGSLFLFEQVTEGKGDDKGGLKEICRYEWTDGLFDVAWCPYADNIAGTCSGDGSIQIWGGLDADNDKDSLCSTSSPLICFKEHKNEVYSLDWGEQWNQHLLLSASWDGSMKLWDCSRQNSVATYEGHSDLIYSARFSPLIPNLFASVGKPLMSIDAGKGAELLTVDWSQFDRNVLVTGGSDGLVKGWDLRNMRQHVFELYSGEFAVRRLAFSPITPTVLASANYDFSTRIWDISQSLEALEVRQNHTEFVCGLDWNANRPHELADCGWDAVVNVFTPKTLDDFLDY